LLFGEKKKKEKYRNGVILKGRKVHKQFINWGEKEREEEDAHWVESPDPSHSGKWGGEGREIASQKKGRKVSLDRDELDRDERGFS